MVQFIIPTMAFDLFISQILIYRKLYDVGSSLSWDLNSITDMFDFSITDVFVLESFANGPSKLPVLPPTDLLGQLHT